jgi:hypothetical protein
MELQPDLYGAPPTPAELTPAIRPAEPKSPEPDKLRSKAISNARFVMLLEQAAREHGVRIVDMLQPGRSHHGQPLFKARADAYIAMRSLGCSYPYIAGRFNRDHSSIHHAVKVRMAQPGALFEAVR